jgi:hypothetical protein
LKTYEKRWIVDIDTKDKEVVNKITNLVDMVRPEGSKIKAVIPTKNGYHLITNRFDVVQFNKYYPEVDIQKKNPTLLYLPNTLDNEEMEHLKDGNYIGGLTMPTEPNDWWDF